MNRWIWVIGFAVVFSATARAAESPVDYLRDVKPLLEKRCFACHGGLAQKSGLRLDTGVLIRQGGTSGPVVMPGKATESVLIERVTETEASLRMPPDGPALSPMEVALLSAWIDQGATSPADEQQQADPREHWSFKKPIRPAVPVVGDGSPANPIDALILKQLAAKNLQPLPEADKPTLLRRVTLDLTGLPPTREELQAFLADGSPDAYDKMVDRLLATPQYGERWGRHWMDVWRYSDWYGRRAVPDVMNSYPHIWRWRDWIVRSLNEDKGYDRMVMEMLAADELTPGDEENVIATGFLVRNWFKWNYETWMKENVEHTGKAFLGLTLNCCHCHDHKYDPISHKEYFQFRAFFEPLELRQDRVAGSPDPGPFQKYIYGKAYGPIPGGMIRVFDEKLDAQTFMYTNGDSRNRIAGLPPVEPGVPAVLGTAGFALTPIPLPPEGYYPGLKASLRTEDLAKIQAEAATAAATLGKARELVATAEKQLDDLRAQASQPVTAATPLPVDALVKAEQGLIDARLTLRVDETNVAATTARLQALTARFAADDGKYRGLGPAVELAKAAVLAEKRAAFEVAQLQLARVERSLVLAERKAPTDDKAKAEVTAAQQQLVAARAAVDATRTALAATTEAYTPLSPLYPAQSTGRRSALARWIANRENPLTARVAVNHMWARHFGRGIVETTASFGRQGRQPSNQELLDWLAVELMDSGWKMKPLHRLMVTSQTYKRRSHLGGPDHPNVAQDRDNIFYWRANTRRMEAEVVRDSVLKCAGELDGTLGGQEIDHAQGLTSHRRSLYFAIHGESKMQFIDLFDGPNVCDCYLRSESVLPTQALAMANSDLVLVQSRVLAGKLWTTSAGADAAERTTTFVRAGFEQVLSRPPSDQELALSVEFLSRQEKLFRETVATPAVAAMAEAPATATDPADRARASLIHALFSHNDFVTIR